MIAKYQLNRTPALGRLIAPVRFRPAEHRRHRLDKGTPVARPVRKARDLHEIARLPKEGINAPKGATPSLGHRVMKHPVTLAAAALLLVACSDSPLAPTKEVPAAPTKASFNVSSSSAALDFTDLSNDMIERLLPSFDDQQVAAEIGTSMRELNAHAMAGEIADAKAASESVRSALKEGVASALLLDVMNRTLDVVDRDLASASAGSSSLTLAP